MRFVFRIPSSAAQAYRMGEAREVGKGEREGHETPINAPWILCQDAHPHRSSLLRMR